MATTTQSEPRRSEGVKPGQRANAADRHVGSRIRERRVMMGLSQQQLARMIGVTYQQAHKYERGINRISAEHVNMDHRERGRLQLATIHTDDFMLVQSFHREIDSEESAGTCD